MRTPPEGLSVRAMEEADIDGLVPLVNQPNFRRFTLRLPFTNRATIAAWLPGEDQNRFQLVAELDGGVVGTASLVRGRGRRAHAGGIGMGVHDAFQGQGIGGALIAGLIDLADDWLGLRRLELEVDVDNEAGIALYRRFGFETEGRHVDHGFREGAYHDAFAMARLRR